MKQNFIFLLGYLYYYFLSKTVFASLHNMGEVEELWRQKKSIVFCCPHYFLLCLFVGIDAAKMDRPVITLLASLSKDGELISRLLLRKRFEMIRGSSSRGGTKALWQLKQAGLEGKSLGLAFDGPKGPPLIPKRGILGCARAVDGSIFLVYGTAKPNKYLSFLRPFRVRSWDRMLIPVPFCSLEIHFEKIADGGDLTPDENVLLKKIEQRAQEVYR